MRAVLDHFPLESPSIASEPHADTAGFNRDLLFESIVTDVQWSAFNLATITCLLNACASKDVQWTLRPWRHLLHDDTHVMKLGLRFSAQVGLSDVAAGEIDKLYVLFSDAKRDLAPMAVREGAYSNACRQTLQRALEKWLAASKVASQALSLLEHDTVRRLSDLHNSNAKLIASFLAEAIAGVSNRVNDWGEISLPELTQRRRAPRMMAMSRCKVIAAGKSFQATLRDISTRGVGLICDHTFADRQHLDVELANGRRLRAVVIWQDNDRLGAELIEPLSMSDPLFAATKA